MMESFVKTNHHHLTCGGFGVAGSYSAQRAWDQRDFVYVERIAAEKLGPVTVGFLHT